MRYWHVCLVICVVLLGYVLLLLSGIGMFGWLFFAVLRHWHVCLVICVVLFGYVLLLLFVFGCVVCLVIFCSFAVLACLVVWFVWLFFAILRYWHVCSALIYPSWLTGRKTKTVTYLLQCLLGYFVCRPDVTMCGSKSSLIFKY